MRRIYRTLIDLSLWCFVMYLATFLPCIEMRVDDFDQPAPREQPPPPTVRPEPIEQYLNLGICFHMNRSSCPPKGVCTTLGPGNMSVFCCDMDTNFLKEFLPGILKQNKTHLHVLNATIDELDVSHSMFRRLTSMAFTDGNISKIIGQFPKHSALACFNISNNNLTSDKLQSSIQRPFAYLFNLTVLDASANNLTKFPLSLVHSNRNISVDLAGNNYLPCKHFQKVMETTNSSLVHFLQYNKTFCALDLSFNWFKDVSFVNIDLIKIQKMMNERCREIIPADINCTCAPERLEIIENEVTNLVSVDCAERQLKEMPTNLPPNTVKLNVSFNNITSLEAVGADESYGHLRQLIVDYNDIPNILELEGTKFIGNFMLFSIAHNKLKTIHTYVLSNSFETTGPALSIAGNFIHCDCNTEKTLKPWLLENFKSVPDYKSLECQDGLGPVVDLVESRVCHTPRDWTDYIYYIIGLEVLVLVLLISKVSYDYWVFKTAGYLPWPANKMPRLPCDWLCE
ncbi:protein halfway isoform X1 [Bombyx mandarina]|uniref:Protein halfway isoform X1 n=1 Tax=Bombyx mandarina TaxID=7092 RepID=A0A6J2K4S4_BOMMA|nr:protein halfway isoform X1 [Bombyx mandarina]